MKEKDLIEELESLHDVLEAGTERFIRDGIRYRALEARVTVLEQAVEKLLWTQKKEEK
jgi:hypothetical protein